MTKRQKRRNRAANNAVTVAKTVTVEPVSTYVPKRDVFAERVIWLANIFETAFKKVV